MKETTQAEFDAFQIDPRRYTLQSSATPTSSTKPMTPPQYNSADLLRRGIKRDTTLFPTLKDDKYCNNWQRTFKTQATAQAMSEVLDETDKPVTADDIALFQKKQKNAYAVLESKILIDRGKAIIWDHEHDFDAQKAYQTIKPYHLQ
jgi:hypothetical protein